MNIIGPDALVFGVDDVAACAQYLTDYGLKPVGVDPQRRPIRSAGRHGRRHPSQGRSVAAAAVRRQRACCARRCMAWQMLPRSMRSRPSLRKDREVHALPTARSRRRRHGLRARVPGHRAPAARSAGREGECARRRAAASGRTSSASIRGVAAEAAHAFARRATSCPMPPRPSGSTHGSDSSPPIASPASARSCGRQARSTTTRCS